MKEFLKSEKFLIIVLSIILILIYIFAFNVVTIRISNSNFVKQSMSLQENNEDTIFKIDKILLYSTATAVDNSESKTLQNVDVSQFTDIAIYINNASSIKELTDKNMVKELYIDNIKINTSYEIGVQSLRYKNILEFSKFNNETLNDETTLEKINFNIAYTNAQNQKNDYDNPTFYTDCSNPITLEYLNKNIIKNYRVPIDSTSFLYNGKMLETMGLESKKINCRISFTIHIKNNLNEEFSYNLGFDNNLEDITNGYILKYKNTTENSYNFLKQI